MEVAGVRKLHWDVTRLIRGGNSPLVTWYGRPWCIQMMLKDLARLPRDLRLGFLRQSTHEIRSDRLVEDASVHEVLSGFKSWRKGSRKL